MEFVPLDFIGLGGVRVSKAAAIRTALSEPGMGYGQDDAKVVWTKTGCVFLGKYTAPRMPNHGAPYVPLTFPAYLVQVLADPIKGWPLINIEIVVVHADTGERDSTYGGGPLPSGMMGTTCGVTP